MGLKFLFVRFKACFWDFLGLAGLAVLFGGVFPSCCYVHVLSARKPSCFSLFAEVNKFNTVWLDCLTHVLRLHHLLGPFY